RNLRQIGLATQLYILENEGRYPTFSGQGWKAWRFGGGDGDPTAAARLHLESATQRPLWSQTTSRELYRSPSDRGMDLSHGMQAFPSTYEMIGTSYVYGFSPANENIARKRLKLPDSGLSGQREDWLSCPSRYILLFEPPAAPYPDNGFWRYFF